MWNRLPDVVKDAPNLGTFKYYYISQKGVTDAWILYSCIHVSILQCKGKLLNIITTRIVLTVLTVLTRCYNYTSFLRQLYQNVLVLSLMDVCHPIGNDWHFTFSIAYCILTITCYLFMFYICFYVMTGPHVKQPVTDELSCINMFWQKIQK